MFSTAESTSPYSTPERIKEPSTKLVRSSEEDDDDTTSSLDDKLPSVPQVTRTIDPPPPAHEDQLLATGILPIDEDMNASEAPPQERPTNRRHVSDYDVGGGTSALDNTTSSSTTTTSRQPSSNATVAARMVDPDEESRAVNKRVQKALQEERERTGVAQALVDTNDDVEDDTPPPPETNSPRTSKGRGQKVLFGVSAALVVAIAIAVAVAVVLTRDESNDAPIPMPTMEPTIMSEPTILERTPASQPAAPPQSDGLSTSVKNTIIVVVMIAVVSASIVAVILYFRQRMLNNAE